MTICFYSPYIPGHFGGGEKHLFDVALSASRFHSISIAIPRNKIVGAQSLQSIKDDYENFLDINLENINFVSTPLGANTHFISTYQWTKNFDAVYYVTDGSLFISGAKHNYLHIQVPLTISKKSPIDRIKLSQWQHKNTNSEFTKQVIEKWWQTKIDAVIHPMVNTSELNATEQKKKYILNVGRFFKHLHSKRQDVLVEIFKKLYISYPAEMKDWYLLLIGTVEDEEYLSAVQKSAENFPIKVMTDVTRTELIEWYKASSVYWHATGYEIDEEKEPEKVEHFGISTVEAMAAGVVPLVQYKGGQKEILGSELRSLGWYTESECIQKTLALITNHQQLSNLSNEVRRRAQSFSQAVFDKTIEHLFTV